MKFKRFLCLLLSTALFILSACSVKVSIGDRPKNINEVLEKTKNEYYDSIVAQQGVEDFKLYLKGDNEVVYEYILSDDSLTFSEEKYEEKLKKATRKSKKFSGKSPANQKSKPREYFSINYDANGIPKVSTLVDNDPYFLQFRYEELIRD